MTKAKQHEYLWFDSRWTRTDKESRYKAALQIFLVTYVAIWISFVWLMVSGITITDPSPSVSPIAKVLYVTSFSIAFSSQVWYLLCMPLYQRYHTENTIRKKLLGMIVLSLPVFFLVLPSISPLLFERELSQPISERFFEVLETLLTLLYAGVWIGGLAYIPILFFEIRSLGQNQGNTDT